MPWWAWLLVDVAIVLGAITVVVRAYWQGWKALRAFLGEVAAILHEVPRISR